MILPASEQATSMRRRLFPGDFEENEVLGQLAEQWYLEALQHVLPKVQKLINQPIT